MLILERYCPKAQAWYQLMTVDLVASILPVSEDEQIAELLEMVANDQRLHRVVKFIVQRGAS